MLDDVTTGVFFLESVIKSMAFGFVCNGPNSYL